MKTAMEQLEFFEIPSPCVGVCQANAKGYCMGCFRTRDERLYWQKLSNGQKQDVLKACRIRKLRAIKAQLLKQEELQQSNSLSTSQDELDF
ncbi:DUF1289 domain-containing protein [Pelistega indica]|nr:DUF1289 domain-containing protein [Pelistega indica]